MAPPNIALECVQCPTEELAEEANRLFSTLMTDSPAIIALTGGDISLLPDLGRAVIRPLVLSQDTGRVFTARDDTGALVGFALFSLPGQLVSTTSQEKAHNSSNFTGKLSPEGQKYYAKTMGHEVSKACDEVLGIQDAERTTYWCHLAMVRSDFQGKGIAKALFALAFGEADMLEVPVALTTTNSRNVCIYEKIGFESRGQRVMSSPWTDWTMWSFVREPAAV